MHMWKNYHTCSGIFNEPVNAGMDNDGKSRNGIYDVYFCLPYMPMWKIITHVVAFSINL